MFVLFKVSANVRVLGMKLSNQMFVYKFSSVFVVGCMLSIGRWEVGEVAAEFEVSIILIYFNSVRSNHSHSLFLISRFCSN